MVKKFFCLIMLFFLASCANEQAIKDEYVNVAQEKMLKDANESFKSNDYNKAAKSYSAIASYYPGSNIARKSQLYAMYSHAKLKETAIVESLAEEFLHQHPRSKEASYAYYLFGIAPLFEHSSFLQRAVAVHPELRGYDLLSTSFKRLKALVRLYPKSPYVYQAKVVLFRIKQILALHENDVANYYYDIGSYQAAINRSMDSLSISRAVETAVPALQVMKKSFAGLNQLDEVSKINKILQLNKVV